MPSPSQTRVKDSLEVLLKRDPSLRAGMPITWVTSEDGRSLPLSSYGDSKIDFSPYIPNPAATMTTIELSLVPQAWHQSFLDVICNFWRYGRPGAAPPKASTVVRAGLQLGIFVRWLNKRGIGQFSDVHPIHVAAFGDYLHSSPSGRQGNEGITLRTRRGVGNVLWACSLPWDLRDRLQDHMQRPPFGEGGITKASKTSKRGGADEATTYCLTLEEYSLLYQACERELIGADEYISALEQRFLMSEQRPGNSTRSKDYAFANWLHIALGISPGTLKERIKCIRMAAATELGLLMGQRISESLSLESGCYSERPHQDLTLGWVTGRTYKTSDENTTWKETEWLAPARASQLIGYLNRLSSVHRPTLSAEIDGIRRDISTALCLRDEAELAADLIIAKRASNSIFLTRASSKGHAGNGSVRIVTHATYSSWLKAMAKKAGLTCPMSAHVLRRSFAYTIVRHCNGDIRQLKVHFQHWTLETTQLYATNAARDEELSDEIGKALLNAKTDLVSSWLDEDEILAGRAGEQIRRTRQKPEFLAHTLKSRRALAESLSEGLTIRPTGHSWCVAAGAPPCGGRGLYDAAECASCDGAVVTAKEIPIWLGLASQLVEAEQLNDCGPGGAQTLNKSLRSFDAILKPFGLSVETTREIESAES